MRSGKIDYLLLAVTVVIVTIGIIMIYSASSIWAEYKMGTPYYYLIRQLIFAGIGFCGMLVFSRIDYHLYFKHATKIFIVCLVLLIIVLIPGIGIVRGGARSWIGIGSFSIQPSEFMKIGVVILLAKYLSVYYKDLEKLKSVIGVFLLVVLVFFVVMLQPDFGTGMIIVASAMLMIFIAGLPLKYIFNAAILGVGGIIGLILSAPYRLERITAFLDPWKDPLGTGFQIIQSLYAIAPGGLFGVGLFNSRQKFFYLPEPQTDFIFAIICEELGFIGAVFVILLFFAFLYRSITIGLLCEDLFGQFLIIGLSSMIFIQFFVNIGVVIGLLPVTGITLPLISYGGSSLTVTLMSIGIILNVTKYRKEKHDVSFF